MVRIIFWAALAAAFFTLSALTRRKRLRREAEREQQEREQEEHPGRDREEIEGRRPDSR